MGLLQLCACIYLKKKNLKNDLSSKGQNETEGLSSLESVEKAKLTLNSKYVQKHEKESEPRGPEGLTMDLNVDW